MFFIIGADGKEYGPATVTQIRGWMASGRANLETKARAANGEEWRTLGDFVEFNPSAALPPPLLTPTAAPLAPSVPPLPVPAADTHDLAGRGARTGAAVLNAFFYFLSTIPGSMSMGRKLLEENPELARGGFPRFDQIDLAPYMQSVAWVWAGLLGAMLLQGILIAIRGQNLGKMAVGVRVVRVSDGEPAGFLHGTFIRFFVPVAIVILLNATTLVLGFVFLFIDYCFIFRQDQRCLHDLMAGTKVVRG